MTTTQAAPLQEADQLDEPADWVISWRLINREPPGRTPTDKEIRLAVWFLLDRDWPCTAISERTGLPRNAVTRVYDLRRLAAQPDRPTGRNGGRTPADARAMRPHWRHLLCLGAVLRRHAAVKSQR